MNAPEDDFFLGRQLLEQKQVSREALLECLFQMTQERRSGSPRPLGVLLVSRGLISQDDLDRIISARLSSSQQVQTVSEAEIGKLLVAQGFVTQDNIEECLRLQGDLRKAGRQAPPLGELVVSRGYVTEPQVQRALAYQNKVLFACSGCGVQIRTVPPPPGNRYRCKKCNGVMAPTEAAGAHDAGRLALREASREEDVQLELDRAIAADLKQKSIVRRDQLRECQRLQTEFARYGMVVPLLELLRRTSALTLAKQQEVEAMNFTRFVQAPDWKKQAIPGYRLMTRIAQGGFAVIWTAESQFDNRRVAVKVLHPERSKDPRSVARFEWEAMLLQRFNCPQIVRGIDHGFERGNHYLVMEFVEGRSLGQSLSESGPFPVRNALLVTKHVAEALAYLHAQGYLHRDVKPDNAIVDAQGNVKLCDLGFAAPIPRVAPDVEKRVTAVGTAGYMAPEMLRGDPDVKVGADIYSLGIFLYALLTGHEPFSGASSHEVVTDQIESGLPVPNLMMVQAPPPVIQFLKRMMHPDRERRFPTAADVIAALNPLIAL